VCNGCNGGNHRSQVVSKFVVPLLNEIKDGYGERKYNAKMFLIDGKRSKEPDYAMRVLTNARDWLTEPWELMPSYGTALDVRKMYAHGACASAKALSKQWWECVELIGKHSDVLKDVKDENGVIRTT
jgi:hypothetical protein